MSPSPAVRVKRAYDEVEAADGVRILVDRLWPRGIRKDDLPLDAWMKDVAPSPALRRGTATVPNASTRSPHGTGRSSRPAQWPMRSRS